jgi:PAS domain S-box-containing protein
MLQTTSKREAGTVRVLVVEDEALIADEMQDRLRNLSYDVIGVADTGASAIKIAEREHPDLVLMDIRLKGKMDGIEAAQQIYDRLEIPTLYVTAHADRATLQRAQTAAAFGYVLKPFEEGNLVAAIETAITQHRERRLARSALRSSEERYQRVFEQSLAYMYIHALEGTLVSVNPAMARALGYPAERMTGRNLREFKVPDAGPDFDRYLKNLLAKGQLAGEMRMLTREGEERIWSYINVMVRPADGQPYVIGNAVDITKLKRTEGELERRENEVRSILDTEPECVKLLDRDGALLEMNKAGLAMLEVDSLDDIRGKQLHLLLAPRYQQSFLNLLKDAFAGRSRRMIFEVTGMKGTHRWMDTHSAPMRNAAGAVTAMIAVTRDITEHKRAEERFRGLLEAAPDAIVIVNADGDISLVNLQTENLFGYTREQLLGRPFEKLLPQRYHSQNREHRRALSGKPEAKMSGAGLDLYAVRKDGSEFPAEISFSPLRSAEGLSLSASIRDITERRKLEHQLRQKQRIESIGTLAGGIAHDFNNLLTVMMSYSGNLAETLEAGSEQQRAAEQIHQAADRGSALTRQLLAFSRQQVFQLRVVNLNDIIRNLTMMLRRLIGDHIEIKSALAGDLKAIKADSGQIEQVLVNLCVNARDAMPEGGTLTLETSNVQLDEEFARQHVGASTGPHVKLKVSDTGMGMDRQALARAFEPFFTTKQTGQGTGLGLAMVYGVVKQSGGSIWLDSEVGVGTTVEIYLPQAGEASEALAPPKHKTPLLRGIETILVMEDDRAVRELVSLLLQSQGYQVLAAKHPGEVESLCAAHSGAIHLLLTDMSLPEISGRSLAERVRTLRPKIKVLYMSGFAGGTLTYDRGLEKDMPFLQKPFSQRDLAVKVREVLDSD